MEEQIGSIFRALKARAEDQERERLEREAEQRRLRKERARQEVELWRLEAEREELERREWEAVVSAGSGKAVHAVRAEHFGMALELWRAAGEIRAFGAALDEVAAASEDVLEAERLRAWSAWGTRRPISSTPRRTSRAWEKPPAQPAPPKPETDPWRGVIDARQDQGWVAIWTPTSRSMVEGDDTLPAIM
ncbi:hypothetical protein ACWCPF_15720 [Streptomyces sp. NPDC001858]